MKGSRLTDVVASSSVTLPFSRNGISIEKIFTHVHVKTKLGLLAVWDEQDSLWVCRIIVICFNRTIKMLFLKVVV